MFERAADILLNEPQVEPQPETQSAAGADRLLDSVGFRDHAAAHQRLVALSRRASTNSDDVVEAPADVRAAFDECLPVLLTMLSQSAMPDESLVNFERYVHASQSAGDLYRYLAERPRATEILVRLFVGSQFLTEILLRNPNVLRHLTVQSGIAEVKSRDDFRSESLAEISQSAEGQSLDRKLNVLRQYQQRQILRIGTCDAFGLMDLKSVTLQLSLLAGGLIQACLELAADELNVSAEGFCVLAMGKLGGEELNYSSDIDLIFLADGDATRFWPLGQRLIQLLVENTAEGFLYRVDMRLRPWGQSGALVNTIQGHMDYLSDHGAMWEKQALLKVRFVAGEFLVAKQFLKQVQPIIFSVPHEALQTNIRNLRSEAQARLRHDGPSWRDVKSGEGSIRDVEFVTQYLQLINGGTIKDVRSANTLDALIRLSDFDIIHAAEYRLLTSGYILLRTIEHSLQLLHNKQTHVLPTDERQLTWLAKRLDFPSAELFLSHCESWCEQIRRIYSKFLEATPESGSTEAANADSLVGHHLARMEPSYSETFSDADIRLHAELLERLTEDSHVEMHAENILEDLWQLTVVGYDRPGDLSVMSGLLFVHGFDIVHGNVFTDVEKHHVTSQRMFVNVFTLRPSDSRDTEDSHRAQAEAIWPVFNADLIQFIAASRTGDLKTAQTRLAKRVARSLRNTNLAESVLYPVDIEIDNDSSETATVLHIRSEDTVGFLYELTNALALNGIDILRVMVTTSDQQVDDTLHVTDLAGNRILAARRLQQLRAAIVLIKHFTHLLPRASNPERALRQFHEFVSDLMEQPDWVEELASLDSPDVLNALARLLGVSGFLWDDFLRLQHENLFPVVKDPEKLAQRYDVNVLSQILNEQLETSENDEQQRSALMRFKDRQLFRTDMRHIVGTISEFGDFSSELTDIAEVVVTAAYEICLQKHIERHGKPIGENGTPCQMGVFALGKCGGRELGFASDIELVFVYDQDGQTDGEKSMAASDFYSGVIQSFSRLLETKQEGIFQVDLRLRPYGQAGPLAVSLSAFREYFGSEGSAWPYERQAMIKLRPIVGAKEHAKAVIECRDACVYCDRPFDFVAMRALREKQIRQMVSGQSVNAKLSPGGLVDCEYFVQALQQENGHLALDLRTTNTLSAIEAIRQHSILPSRECDQLVEAYIFLRRLIDALRMVRGNAKDLAIPLESVEEFEFLSRRLGYGPEDGVSRDDSTDGSLGSDIELHFQNVTQVLSGHHS